MQEIPEAPHTRIKCSAHSAGPMDPRFLYPIFFIFVMHVAIGADMGLVLGSCGGLWKDYNVS